MKKVLLAFSGFLSILTGYTQCTTTNATSCVCPDTSSNCELLPDITISWYALENYMGGPDEYPQICTPACGGNDGRLRITGSTPNIGYGSFTVLGSDYFVCGTDTIYDPNGTILPGGLCTDGTPARQLIVQRIYVKNGSTMNYYDRWAGAMTYHPTHGHNHVDDWGVFTLRLEDPNETNPLNWPIVGNGAKLGFCLMDYGQCGTTTGSTYAHHCKDTNMYYQQGTTLLNADFPNWGLGGGAYNCSPVIQGISVGYTDVYSESLDGMWINIPPGICNGQYWIVAEVDPLGHFLEMNELNNWTAIPITLTQQNAPGSPVTTLVSNKGNQLCVGDTATITATTGFNYLWSTGDTTQSIEVSQAGNYYCTVTTYCGTATSDTMVVSINPLPGAVTANSDTVCIGQTATLTTNATNPRWYNSSGTLVSTSSSYTTGPLSANTTFYVNDANVNPGVDYSTGKPDNTGGGGFFASDQQYLNFNCSDNIILKSVMVYSSAAANRTIMVLDNVQNIVAQGSFFIPADTAVVNLNFSVPAGNGYSIRISGQADLFRNSSGVLYPYTDPTGTVSITGSSAGGNYYYFFYNWVITLGYAECAGPQTAVTAIAEDCSGIDENVDLLQRMNVFPNPNQGHFTFTFEIPGTTDFTYVVYDMFGRAVVKENINHATGKFSKNILMQNAERGMYIMSVEINGQKFHKKIVVN